MDKKVTAEISFTGLPVEPNNNRLAVELEDRINRAVAQALCDVYDNGTSGIEWTVHVPSF